MDEGDNLQDLVPFQRSFCEVMTMQRLDSILIYISLCYQTYVHNKDTSLPCNVLPKISMNNNIIYK